MIQKSEENVYEHFSEFNILRKETGLKTKMIGLVLKITKILHMILSTLLQSLTQNMSIFHTVFG